MEHDMEEIQLDPLDTILPSLDFDLWSERSDLFGSDWNGQVMYVKSPNGTDSLKLGTTDFDELIDLDNILQGCPDIQQVTLSSEEIELRESEIESAFYVNLDDLKTVTPSHNQVAEPQMLPPFTVVFQNESIRWNEFSEDVIDMACENNTINYDVNEIKECSPPIAIENIIEMSSQSSVSYDEPSSVFKKPAPKVKRRGRPAKPVKIERNELEMARLSEEDRKFKEMRLRNNESCRKTRRKIQRETQELLEECVILKSTNKKLKKIYLKKKSLHNVIVNEFKSLL